MLFNYALRFSAKTQVSAWRRMLSSKGSASPSNILFIGNIPRKLPRFVLEDAFRPFNPKAVEFGVILARDGKSQTPGGFAFVYFNSQADAKQALDANAVNPLTTPKGPATLEYSEPRKYPLPTNRSPNPPNKRVIIRGFPRTSFVEERVVREIFEKFGPVNGFRRPADILGQSARFAFVEFADVESAQKAVDSCWDVAKPVINGHEVAVDFVLRPNEETL